MKEMSQQNLPFWAKNTTLAVQIYFEIYTLVKRFCSNFPALSSKKLFFHSLSPPIKKFTR